MQQIHIVYTGISAVVVRSLIFQITCIGILLKLCVLGRLFRSVDLCKKEISSCNQHIQRTQSSSYTKRKNKTQEIEQLSKHLPCNICILFFVILALEKILMIIITDVWFVNVDLFHRNYFAKSGLFRYFDFRVFTYIFNGCFSTYGTFSIIIRVPGFAPSTQQAIGEFFQIHWHWRFVIFVMQPNGYDRQQTDSGGSHH